MDDQILFLRVQDGDEKAYERLFVKYYAPLCEFASLYVQDADSEELVQDLMLHIWESREVIVIETSVKSYLFTAIKHRCLNAIRRKIHHEQVHERLYEKLKDQFEEPDYYLHNELADNIERAICELPENYRETFELSRFGEMTNTQIAQQLSVSVKTVEYRITQSLKIMRVKLKDYLSLLVFLLWFCFPRF
ncbi:MAG: RNA polymerase sigma-70 factor [Tannerella sp.]|jgi:RNA polymerase sigma-70 factor (ECF subfamily)|nr:RNA polymerase sigma-70 factor [Tannerella sp.]